MAIAKKLREPLFCIGVGARGIGKTYQTERRIKQITKGYPAIGLKPRKVLIVDVNNEYKDFRPIGGDEKSIKSFVAQEQIECRRIVPFANGKTKNRADLIADLNNVLSYFYNGTIVLEDLTLIVGDATSIELVGSLATIRHRDVDVYTHFQSIGKFAHPKFKSLKNLLRLHKTHDSCNRSTVKGNLDDDFPIIRIAEIMVDKRYDIGMDVIYKYEKSGIGEGNKNYDNYNNNYKRFYVIIDFDNQKVSGIFTKKEFEDACVQYLQEESNMELNPLIKFRDAKTGKALYTFQTALQQRLKEYMRYYGNEK